MDHLALTKREITEWSTRITDENTSLRRRKAHALHFLGAQDATAVKGQYRALSLPLHPDKKRTDPMATERFKVLGAAKDLFDSPVIGLPHVMRHMVLHEWTWKTGVLLTELTSFPLQVQFLVGKEFLRVRIFANKLPMITCF